MQQVVSSGGALHSGRVIGRFLTQALYRLMQANVAAVIMTEFLGLFHIAQSLLKNALTCALSMGAKGGAPNF